MLPCSVHEPPPPQKNQPVILSAQAHVDEPAKLTMTQLPRRLREISQRKPFIVEDGDFRRLHFSLRYIQSEMSLRAPYTLTMPYTQSMMAFLLFNPRPKHVVIVGLGGGSLTKFCYRQLPATRVTTVEIDEAIIDMAKLFEVPEEDARLRIVHADAVNYFSTTRQSADVILLDGCDQNGMVAAFCDESFYAGVRMRLRPGGLLVVNIIGNAGGVDALQRTIANAFDDQVVVLKVSVGGNRILFASRESEWPPDWAEIKQRAVGLAAEHDLDLVAFAGMLERNHHERLARTITAPEPKARR